MKIADIKKANFGKLAFQMTFALSTKKIMSAQYNVHQHNGQYQHQFSVNSDLTEIATRLSIKNVPGSTATRRNFKQIIGGNATNYQPPLMRGFFMPATSGDCTFLPGVVDYKIPAYGKVHSVRFTAFPMMRLKAPGSFMAAITSNNS